MIHARDGRPSVSGGEHAGRWTINGALFFMPYRPSGDNISQIIYVANRAGQTGDITIDAFDEQGATYSFSGGTVVNSQNGKALD